MTATSAFAKITPASAHDPVENPDQLLAQTTRSWLDDQAFVVVSGVDVRKFLQGQLTCHLDEVTATHSVSGSYCTVQGRMITSFRVAQRGDGALLLRMHASVVEPTVQTLKKYGVFSKVQIGVEPDYIALSVEGGDSAKLLAGIVPASPVGKNAAVCNDAFVAIQTDDAAQRFEIWVDAANAADIWQKLAAATTAGAALWRLRNIRDGIGHVEARSQDMFIPQMLNFQQTGFVHFKKGCYTGQEIVARMQYLGKLKRHMYRFDVQSDTAPLAGDELMTTASAQSIGNIVSSVATGDQRFEVLAVTTDDTMDADTLHIRGRSGQRFRRLELPYAITVGTVKTERRKP
jgi:folate-binding protein YgfZ